MSVGCSPVQLRKCGGMETGTELGNELWDSSARQVGNCAVGEARGKICLPLILNELTFEQKVVCFFFFSWQAESLYRWLQGFLVFDPQKVFSESWLLKL